MPNEKNVGNTEIGNPSYRNLTHRGLEGQERTNDGILRSI